MRGILVAILLGFCSSLTAQIFVEHPSKDLGDVYESKGEVAAHFTLKNPYSEDTIRIHEIITSCGCTAILSQDTLIPPNSSIQLKFSYNPKGRSGLFTKSIEVVSRIGVYDQHRLFLKISGNVVSENYGLKKIDAELKEYLVAPINFYSITPYDTSYLDFNFFISFVNDLSYEIDFYQFTTLGIEIGVRDQKDVEEMQFIAKYIKGKLVREFRIRGYSPNTVFFEEPTFVIDEVPQWAKASVKVYSVNFGSDLIENSVIKLNANQIVENQYLLLNYQRFSRPDVSEVIEQINFDQLENKLFINGSLDLKGVIMSPSRMTYADREKLAAQLEKQIFKNLKKNTGASSKDVTVRFDSMAYHPENKYKFQMWDVSDEEEKQEFNYEIKPDNITPPLLPTYRQSTLLGNKIDVASSEFKYFWKNLLLNHKAGYPIKLLIESSKSKIPRDGEDNLLLLAHKEGNEIKKQLLKLFLDQTGRTMDIEVKPFVHGPDYIWQNKKYTDYSQYEYFNLIPIVHPNNKPNNLPPKPYMVNFDYYFNGVDTSSWVFSKLAKYIAEEVKQFGYVELIMESSISQIPIETKKKNIYLAYERALESQIRIKHFMQHLLIDPNRILFVEERFLVQGPKYDGTIPIIKFRKFQYVKIVPKKHLTE